MDQRNGSVTALGVAGLRAAHQLMDGEPRLLSDPVIVQLLEPLHLQYIQENPARYRQPESLHLRSHVLLRSRYTEDQLALAFQRGIRQFLILGAGMDTFCWRQPPGMEALQVFEVDHPSSQAYKRLRLSEAGIPTPANVHFVPVDFESTSLRQGLQDSAFDFSLPSFISWLGVTMYLTMEAIDEVLAFIASLPKGTEIALTFAQKKMSGPTFLTADRAAAVGEPWLSFFTPDELTEKLKRHGFASVSFLEPGEAWRVYFAERTDNLPPPRRAFIAHAVV